jgi:hypothetical protein
VVGVVHTRYNSGKGTWRTEKITDFYSLDELSYVVLFYHSVRLSVDYAHRDMYHRGDFRDGRDARKSINPIEGSLEDRESARAEFMRFASTIYEDLYRIESRILSARSALSIFCRIDIGLIVNTSNGKLNYFVNEVERTATASLWSDRGDGHGGNPIGTVGTTFAASLYRWLRDVCDPYH